LQPTKVRSITTTTPFASEAALLGTGLADLQEARWIHYCQKAGIPIGGCQRAVCCEPLSGEEIVAELRDARSVMIVGCSLCANTIHSPAKDLPLEKSSANVLIGSQSVSVTRFQLD
jgi:hypothetical protein